MFGYKKFIYNKIYFIYFLNKLLLPDIIAGEAFGREIGGINGSWAEPTQRVGRAQCKYKNDRAPTGRYTN